MKSTDFSFWKQSKCWKNVQDEDLSNLEDNIHILLATIGIYYQYIFSSTNVVCIEYPLLYIRPILLKCAINYILLMFKSEIYIFVKIPYLTQFLISVNIGHYSFTFIVVVFATWCLFIDYILEWFCIQWSFMKLLNDIRYSLEIRPSMLNQPLTALS